MKPWRVTIDTNPDVCNLHCIMCDTHSLYNQNFKPQRKSMSRELLSKSIDEALKLDVKEIIPSMMGEPLMYSHFDIFIDKLKGSKTKLNLTTNGTFPNGVESWAERLLPVLSDIKISINGINSKINESIMVDDDTQKKLEDIKYFASLRDKIAPAVTITLQVTFLKSNLDELENIIKFAIENGLNRVKGHQLWINYDEIRDESLYNHIGLWNEFIDKIDIYKKKIKLVHFEKLEKQNSSNFVPQEYGCPFLKEEIWINYNGNFNICCAPSQKRVMLGKWGNINSETIEEVFSSKKYLDLAQNYKTKDICKKCTLRRPL